ncbi:mast cell protease 1A-like [Pelodiscus sinensis]|uniref:mast cell protease 1A-like n=1 Tax=Pelodiscus sinensis TaxID=13735 RepID=UPI003F6C80C8
MNTQLGEIIGGHEAKPHSRPYMAYLLVKRDNKYYDCGGFLVEKNFVLTAAHCLGDSITVILGAHNLKQPEGTQKITVQKQQQIPYPQYNDRRHNNDIMLLKLSTPALLNKFVKTLALPEYGKSVKVGTKCSVAGWGLTIANNNSSASNTLQEAHVKVLKDGDCPYQHYNPLTMLCAGKERKGKDAAKGDSGGPLVCGDKAHGIVSWGYDHPPGVYTRVSTFVNWIKNTMNRPQP